MNKALASFSPRRQNRRGFIVAPLLYILGLIGVIGGVIYSNNMQSIRSVLTVQNSLTVRSDLGAAANTLSAEAVFSADNQKVCPPRSVHQTSGEPCATAPVGLTQIGDLGTDLHLPANVAAVGSSGAPVEVGIFPAGAGMKQLDPNGHYYIYCRWENPRSSPASPAFVILSAGQDGNLQTQCGDTTAKGDDALTMVTVGETINRAALWQSDASNNVSYGATGSKVTIDSDGDLFAAGNITAGGSLNGQSAAIANGLTAGNVTATNGSFADLSGTTLEISNTATIGGTTTLGVLNAQASTLDSLTVNNSATMNGGLSVNGGDLILANGYSYAQIDSTGNSRRLIALSPENDILLGGHNGTGNIYFLTNNSTVGYVDVEGDLAMTGNIVGINGTFSGNSTATNYTASSTVTGITGNFQNLTAGNTTINGNLTATGTITASSFNGTLTVGNGSNGVTISGIIPVANGGTGASSSAVALNDLGVTSGGVFNTGLLAAGLINGSYLTSGTVTSTQLNQTGVTAGNCPAPTVGLDGRITACGTSVTVSAAGSTGDIQFNNGGNFSASGGLFWDNTHGYLGVGTSSPAGILDVEGGKAASNASGTNIKLVAQSAGSGNTNGGNILFTPGAGSGSGFAGSVLIGSTCTAQSWLSYGLCATGDILSEEGFVTQDNQPYGWGVSSSQISGYGESSANDNIRFLTNNAERARFDGSGHFGIGTTNPTSTLTVVGNGNLSGTVTVGSSLIVNGTASLNQGVFVSGGSLTAGTSNLGATNVSSLTNSGTETVDGLLSMDGGGIAIGSFTVNGTTTQNGPLTVNGPASFSGYVGFGTTSPVAAADIAGYVRLAKYSSAPATCSSSNDGAIALTSKHTLCVCNGAAWATIADGSSACAWTNSSAPIQIVLSTAGCATWTVPANWNSTNSKIEAVGAGAGGASFNLTSAGSVGGGGGAYSAITNLALTAGATVNYCIGNGGNGETGSAAAQTGGDTWFNATTFASSSVAAKGGSAVSNGNTGGNGGLASSGIGSVKFSGGNGGNSGTDNAGAGGGGAAGPDGNGLNGIAGASGSALAGGAGGNGDNGDGGTGGLGGTSSSKNGSSGNTGTYSGGGGGGGGYSDNGNGGNGGSPGAGGGGGGSDSNSTNGGQGAVGEIVITYTP